MWWPGTFGVYTYRYVGPRDICTTYTFHVGVCWGWGGGREGGRIKYSRPDVTLFIGGISITTLIPKAWEVSQCRDE